MNDASPRRIWLCADDYGLAEGVNRAIRDLIDRGRLNATSVMVVGSAIGRDEVKALQAVAAKSPRCAIGLHVTLTAPFRPLTMHFRPMDGGMLLPFPKLLPAGLLRRPHPDTRRALCFSVGATPSCGRGKNPRQRPGSARADATCLWRSGWARPRRWCSTS